MLLLVEPTNTPTNMPGVKNMHESDGEEMDQETAESEKTSNEDTDSTTGSGSDDDDSSEVDEEQLGKRRSECVQKLAYLAKEFAHVKEQLYIEKSNYVENKLKEVKMGIAREYNEPLDKLHQNMQIRLEVAEIMRRLKLANIKNVFEAEKQACLQNFESEKALLRDSIRSDLEEKIRCLEEDRNSIDITADLSTEHVNQWKNKRKADQHSMGRRKKPVTVSAPYIVYMLPETDILEDWTTIRKALKASKQLSEHEFTPSEQRVNTRFADGKLLYKGNTFREGESVIIDEKINSPLHAHIISVNTSEVLLQRFDRSWTRLPINDLQSGKSSIRHAVS